MERILVAFVLTAGCLVCGLSGAGDAHAASPAKTLAKTRPGSVLKGDKLFDEAPDLRGEAERARDYELSTYVKRMAQLDVLAKVASEAGEVTLQEGAEQVRRKEVNRHEIVMMRLRHDWRQAHVVGVHAVPLGLGMPAQPEPGRAPAKPPPSRESMTPREIAAANEAMAAGGGSDKGQSALYRRHYDEAQKEITADNAYDRLHELERQVDLERQKVR
jgi:hypothetical protein